MPGDPLIRFLDDAPSARAAMGGKAAALAALTHAGLPVPPGFVLAPEAFASSLPVAPDSAPDAEALANLVPAPAVLDALGHAISRLAGEQKNPRFAVRSSAGEEDGAAHSFAGQLESFLCVPSARVAARVADVWRSAFSERIVAYRRERGLAGPPLPPAVLVQRMVAPDAAGVAFSADPVSGRTDVAVVAAVRGLASALVDGRATGETVRVAADGRILDRTPPDQLLADRFDAARGEGVVEEPVVASGPILSDPNAVRVAALARAAEVHFGRPQDVEWALDKEKLWLLQSRPITTLPDRSAAERPEADGTLRLWDNSNIAESYGGVTTPLTFSFARRAYAAVYRQFCRLLRVPERRIEAHADTFDGMIGLVRGHVFYNLANWYRVLALLPGYRTNARFMEGMMGMREGIPDELRPAPVTEGRLADALALARTTLGLVTAHARLPAMRRAFLLRLDAALALPPGGLDAYDLDGLAAYYLRLDRALLARWDAPLVNDFFAMIHFGLAQRLAERWIGPGALGHLLTGGGDVVSAEPARRVHALARRASGYPDWARMLADGSRERIESALAEQPEQAAEFSAYLDRFGDRCLDELKLESLTLADDPTPLFRAVGALAGRMAGEGVPEPGAVEERLRAEAEVRADAAFGGHPFRRLVFGRVLALARARVRDRENLRFERTRVFGRARRIFLAMGRHLTSAGLLDDPRDVFFLELNELLGAADGTATTHDLRGLAKIRQAEFDGYRAAAPPPDRFLTRGALATSPLTRQEPAGREEAEGEVRTGLGCCPGVVEGPARVVRDPRGVALAPGPILVAERTDPGWILLFPSCAGLVVERGSLLSHSAIVARELGIPAAVGVPGATAWLRDGDRIRLDGANGRVERLAPAVEAVTVPTLADAEAAA